MYQAEMKANAATEIAQVGYSTTNGYFQRGPGITHTILRPAMGDVGASSSGG